MIALQLLKCIVVLSSVEYNEGLLVENQVDLIEINHFYDEHGREIFDQVIFYEWDGDRFQVIAWRLLKKPNQIPQKDFNTGEYVTIWYDGDVLRRVRAKAYIETWTQYDPELREREFRPKDRRPELTKWRTSNAKP